MRTAVVYARVSSREQAEEGYSIDAQLKLLRQYAAEHELRIDREFVDVETAKQAGRIGFGEMVEHLRRRKKSCRVVLVEKTDRLYRNLRDYVTLDDLSLEVHLVKEGIVLSDDSRSHEKFMHGIKVLMAKNYVDNLSEEASKGMREKASQGTWPSAAPIGYLNVQNGDKREIEPDPETAPIVRKVFEWYAAGDCSLAEVARRAASEGLTTRFGKLPGKTTIERILKNPFYIGTFTWGGRTYIGTHEPLITADLFQRVRGALGKTNHPVEEAKRSFAYTGLIKCAHCGCSITAEIRKGKYIYYHCTGSKGGCDKPAIREERLEELLGEIVKRLQISDDDIGWIVSALKESHQDEKVYHEEQLSKLQAETKRLQDRMDAAYEDKLDGTIGEETWRRKSHEWRSRQLEVQAAIESHLSASHVYYESGVKLLRLAQTAYTLWLNQPQSEKRKLLNLLQSNCTFDGTSLTATYKKPFCWLAEGPGCSVWRG